MEPTATDWAYLAGLIDGEGTFIRRTDKGLCRLRVAMNAPDLLLRLPARYGAGTSFAAKPYTGRDGRKRHPWTWTVNSADELVYVLTHVMPYLTVKRPQAERVLAFAKLCRFSGPTSPARQRAFDALADLNH